MLPSIRALCFFSALLFNITGMVIYEASSFSSSFRDTLFYNTSRDPSNTSSGPSNTSSGSSNTSNGPSNTSVLSVPLLPGLPPPLSNNLMQWYIHKCNSNASYEIQRYEPADPPVMACCTALMVNSCLVRYCSRNVSTIPECAPAILHSIMQSTLLERNCTLLNMTESYCESSQVKFAHGFIASILLSLVLFGVMGCAICLQDQKKPLKLAQGTYPNLKLKLQEIKALGFGSPTGSFTELSSIRSTLSKASVPKRATNTIVPTMVGDDQGSFGTNLKGGPSRERTSARHQMILKLKDTLQDKQKSCDEME